MPSDTPDLSREIIDVFKQRGWSLAWDARLAYLGLESAEFVEAVRGKRGDKTKEAGDVIITAMALIEGSGVSWDDAMAAATETVSELRVKPRYAGEYVSTEDSTNAH